MFTDSLEVGPGPVERGPRLWADAMLAGLARWLRVLDVDTAFEAGLEDALLVDRAVAEQRMILTRDRRLLERRLARTPSSYGPRRCPNSFGRS